MANQSLAQHSSNSINSSLFLLMVKIRHLRNPKILSPFSQWHQSQRSHGLSITASLPLWCCYIRSVSHDQGSCGHCCRHLSLTPKSGCSDITGSYLMLEVTFLLTSQGGFFAQTNLLVSIYHFGRWQVVLLCHSSPRREGIQVRHRIPHGAVLILSQILPDG